MILRKIQFKEFVDKSKNQLNISGNIVHEIFQDKKGRLWFTTNNGLIRFDRSTEGFVHFGEKNGLPNNIHGILEDDHGYLWMSTTKGISRFDPETNNLRNYDASYGVEPPADAPTGNACKTRNGEMYFSGAKGFTRFHPDSIKDNPFIPTIVITSFRKFDNTFSASTLKMKFVYLTMKTLFHLNLQP